MPKRNRPARASGGPATARTGGKGTRAKPRHPEAAEQRLFVKRWRLDPRTRDLPACAVPNGIRTSAIQAALAKADGMSAGVPDWMCFARPADGLYNGLALEFKRPDGKGRLSPEQVEWHVRLVGNGWYVQTVTVSEQAWRVVLEYFGFKE